MPYRNILTELDFNYSENPRTLKTNVTIPQSLEVLKTGLLDNKPVSKVRLFSIEQDGLSVTFIYDIQAAKSGSQPWSIESNSTQQQD